MINEIESLTQYYKEIEKYSILTLEEEKELYEGILNKEEKAINKIVTSNLRFVISVAKEYQNQGIPLMDLINEGNHGLIKAVGKFNPSLGYRFLSYAVWWIRQSILQSLNDNSRTIRIPTNLVKQMLSDKRENKDSDLKLPNCRNLTEILSKSKTSFDTNSGQTSSEINFVDSILEDNNYEYSNIYNLDDKTKKELNNSLSCLSNREREIIESYFGVNKEHDGMTLECIGKKYNLTKERIRQIKENAIRKIRNNSDNLFDLLYE
jgi:RNA polymerase primary sigma factor